MSVEHSAEEQNLQNPDPASFEQLPPPPASAQTPVIVGLLVICTLGMLGIVGMGYAMMQPQARNPRILSQAEVTTSSLTGAMKRGKSDYTPTSQYVEPGADSDVTELDLSASDSAPDVDPELIDEGPSEDALQRVITSNQMELIECYAQGLEEDPDLQGRVDFHFRIAPDGHVAMVKVTRSALKDKPTEDCFVNKSRRWSFPKSSKKVALKFDTNLNFAAQ